MLSNLIGIQQCDLARSTRTAYGSKHFRLTQTFARYALKIYDSRQDEEFVTLLRLYNKQSSMYINAIKKELWSSAFRLG